MKIKLILAILLLPFYAMAATNQFTDVLVNGTLRTSNVFTRGYINVNTNNVNAVTPSNTITVWPAPGQTDNMIFLRTKTATAVTGIEFGDTATLYGGVRLDGNSPNNLAFENFSGSPGDFYWNDGGIIARWNRSLFIYGLNSSTAHTWNGSTFTYANPVTINAGVQTFPTSTTGNTTNGANRAVFLNGIITSNATFTGASGSFRYDAGTNALILATTDNIYRNGGFIARTNTLSGSMVIDSWYTNNSSQLRVSVSVRLPGTLTSCAAVKFQYQIPGITNSSGTISGVSGLSGVLTNQTGGFVPPNGLYRVTSVGVDTPTIVLPDYLEHN